MPPLSCCSLFSLCAAADLDGDGASNRNEFLVGTDPTNPWSRLAIHEVRREGDVLSLFFPTVKGKSYAGESSDSLPALNWLPFGNMSGDGAEQFITETNAMPMQRFFRIRVTP